MLRDEEFSSRAKVDRYGRKLPKNAAKKELERYYRIENEKEDEVDEDDEIELELERANAKDERLSTSSSEESSSDDEESKDSEEDEVFGLPDERGAGIDGVLMGEPSSRLAVVNLDWDNIRAADLMAVFSSFVPANGRILKVSVYPSEFGKERIEREEMEGPPKEIFASGKSETRREEELPEDGVDDVDDDIDDKRIEKSILREDEGQEFNSAKLRRYQLERLRYYYAVLACSSTFVAQAIYDTVDGAEYLTTANFFDLRFIPDNIDFLDDKPRDECEVIPDGYRPNEFVTDALQHSKVRLTWDADDGTRKEAQKRAFTGSRAEMDENDLKAYLGTDSSEDEGPEPEVTDDKRAPIVSTSVDENAKESSFNPSKKDAERQKMRSLLGLTKEEVCKNRSTADIGPVGDMQITFTSGFSSEPNKTSVFENEPEPDETTIEKYVRKEKERKARRKENIKSKRTAVTSSSSNTTANPITAATNPQQSPPQPPQSSTSDPPQSPNPHFSLPNLLLAEKLQQKSLPQKKRKLSKRQQAALEHQATDTFKMDVQDPRFGAVYERPEFAIDPLHKGFKSTGGMKMILEEGRRRRGRTGGEKGGGIEREKEREGKKRRREKDEDVEKARPLEAKVLLS